MTLIEFLKKLLEKLTSSNEIEENNDELTEKTGEEKMENIQKENYERFPANIFEPQKIVIDGDKYAMFLARFNSLYSLYEYLKDNPKINHDVFRGLDSETGSTEFAGKPYKEAVEDLIATDDPGYEEFLTLQRRLDNGKNIQIHKYQTVKTVAGGHLNVPAYSMGSPLCYETEERVVQPKFVRIHITLSYNWRTSKRQVLNRAIIITNILKALENAGYSVDLNAFELSEHGNELINIIVQLKRHGEKLNMQALYKSLCHVEFLRRILFRILETLNVTGDWNHGYGHTCDEDFVKKVLKFDKNDIYFDQPDEMGIDGDDLSEDFEHAISHLGLENKIDVERAKREFKQKVKILDL